MGCWGIKSFSVGICDSAPSTARSSCDFLEIKKIIYKIALSLVSVICPGLEVINLEASLRLKIKRNDWLLVDTCPQAANHCTSFRA